MSSLVLRNLHVTIGKRELIKDLNIQFHEKSFNALVGPNGAGKSTLLKAIAKMSVDTRGKVEFNGENLHALSTLDMAKKISYMAQFSQTPNLSVSEVLSLGRRAYSGVTLGKNDHLLIDEMVEKMQIKEWLEVPLENLSGGERQKVFIISTLLQKPKILLLDEPISHLDPKNQHMMLEMIKKETYERGMITLIVLHDIHHALHYADKVIMLKNGRLVGFKRSNEVCEDDVQTLFNMPLSMYEIHGHKFIYYKHSHAYM